MYAQAVLLCNFLLMGMYVYEGFACKMVGWV